MNTEPAAHFTRHGLSVSGLRRADTGFSNEVWLTDASVLRLGAGTDHAREAALALGALAAGVRTARPLFWGPGYSLWERLPGGMLTPSQLTPVFWNAVLDDLERLQATRHPKSRRPGPRSGGWAILKCRK